ncbi:MAG: T9SS type A sorting domain-containing protein [Candidatus Eisenbacteria bacterium]|nr:T9SS type A sorting domain-containing protein [Candidatus Eisenbacteria bacterium]
MRQTSRGPTVLMAASALLVMLFAGSAVAGLVTQHYEFPEPVLTETGEYVRVEMEGAMTYGAPGMPALPMAGASLLLPPGEEIDSVRVIPGERVVLPGTHVVEPGQRQYPLSFEGPFERFEADYDGLDVYPSERHAEPNFGFFRGHGIASAALHPVEYDPATGEIAYYRSLDLEITTRTTSEAMRTVREKVRTDARTRARLSRIVDNSTRQSPYASVERVRPISRSLDPSLEYKYVIVTTDSWDDYLGTFVDFQTQRGYKAGIFLKSWITSNYTGDDEQMQIRNFIIDAYNTWDIDYVLLVGDTGDANGIPHRGMWNDAYGESEYNIPCDLYYSGLDGTWNDDGDSMWGEYSPEEADLYPELAIGRACIDDVAGVQNFVNKTLLYVDSPIVSESDEALMAGELLWSSPLTYGGTYKDEVKDGSSANGYTTVGFPGSMNVGTLYDRDATWSASTLINAMESGLNIVNHLGHCNVQYAMKMYNSDIPSFDNDGTNHSLNFVYSQGCYCGSFDNRDSYGSYPGDCFAEEFTADDDGAVAVVMNSRYGWGDPGGTNGASQFFDREFFDAMFAEGIYPIGEANDDSKMDAVWALSQDAVRWCYYQLTVFGDPAMHLWTGQPTALTVNHPSAVMVGQPSIDVTVMDGGSPVDGARVTVWTDDYSVYDTALTGGTGLATVEVDAQNTGTLNIKVHAHDYLTWNGDIPINPASGPYVTVDGWVIDDDQSGDSDGNGDAAANAGETVELVVTVENVGVDPAYGVNATLSSTSGYVTIVDDYEEYGDVSPSATAQCGEDYDFEIATGTPDGEVIPFTLTISGTARETWESNFGIAVTAPVVEYASHSADDPAYGGNGNGCIEAGETIAVSLSLENTGGADATNVSATITSADPYVQINQGTSGMGTLASGATQPVSPDYSVTVLPDCPGLHEIVFDVSVGADWGYGSSHQFSLLTSGGDFADDIESGEGEWTHGSVTPGFIDEWHIDTYRYHSSGHSWKFGGTGSNGYGDSADGGLVMRPMCIGANGQLSFWHWMYAEEESGTSAWDCGLVEYTIDGGATWDVLHPDTPYSHAKNYNPANPLPEGTPCWSGSFTWRQETFDLSAYAGETIQIRFRFASDGYVTEEGWYVDDIELTSDSSTDVADAGEMPIEFGLKQNVPNPFNPVTVIQYQLPQPAHVRLDIYNVAGKLVRTVVDERQEAGYRSVTWNGRDENGHRVASGVYLYRMQAADHVSKKMMVLLK